MKKKTLAWAVKHSQTHYWIDTKLTKNDLKDIFGSYKIVRVEIKEVVRKK